MDATSREMIARALEESARAVFQARETIRPLAMVEPVEDPQWLSDTYRRTSSCLSDLAHELEQLAGRWRAGPTGGGTSSRPQTPTGSPSRIA